MPAQMDPDLTLYRAARAAEDARLAARSATGLPIHHRELVRCAVRHLDVAQEQLFKVANMPRDRTAPEPRQLSLEVPLS